MTTLVLLPGLDGTGVLFQPLLEQLDQDYHTQVIAYPKDQSLSLDALAERIEYETQDLVDVTLVAESFGGLVALALLKRAILKPQRIIFCVAFGDSPQPWVLKLANRLPIHYLPWHLVPAWGIKTFVANPAGTEREVVLFRRVAKLMNYRVIAHRLKIIASAPFSRETSAWSLPCCYLQATEDRVVPAHCLDWFRSRFTDLTTHRLRSGHFLLQTKAQDCARLIQQFVEVER